jgi:hypothetical protein
MTMTMTMTSASARDIMTRIATTITGCTTTTAITGMIGTLKDIATNTSGTTTS